MATQNLIEQHILFIAPSTEIDALNIQANSLVQSLASNSLGNAIIQEYRSYVHWDGSNWTTQNFFEMIVFCQPSFQATIQQNIPNLQSAFPGFTIVTYGFPVTWGF